MVECKKMLFSPFFHRESEQAVVKKLLRSKLKEVWETLSILFLYYPCKYKRWKFAVSSCGIFDGKSVFIQFAMKVKGLCSTLVLCERAVRSECVNKPYMNCKQHINVGKAMAANYYGSHFNEIWKIICLSQDEFLPPGSHLNFWLSEITNHRQTRHVCGPKVVTLHKAL